MSGNIYNQADSTAVRIAHINNTISDLQSSLLTCQIGIATDKGQLAFKNHVGTNYVSPSISSYTNKRMYMSDSNGNLASSDLSNPSSGLIQINGSTVAGLLSYATSDSGYASAGVSNNAQHYCNLIGYGDAVTGTRIGVYKADTAFLVNTDYANLVIGSELSSSAVYIGTESAWRLKLNSTGVYISNLSTGYVKSDSSGLLSYGSISAGDIPAHGLNSAQHTSAISEYFLYRADSSGLPVASDIANTSSGTLDFRGSGHILLKVRSTETVNDRTATLELIGGNGSDSSSSCIIKTGMASGSTTYEKLQIRNSANSTLLTALYNGNVGIGNTSPDAKLSLLGPGYSAAGITWPHYDVEDDTNSFIAQTVYAGGNGGTGTAGYGPTAVVKLGHTYDSRAVITMASAAGSSPSDQGTGYGKDLMIKAGNSDNSSAKVGGRLYLQGGSGYVANFGVNYGALLLQSLGGNVGIGMETPGKKLTVSGDAMVYSSSDISSLYVGEETTGRTYLKIQTSALNSGYCSIQSQSSGSTVGDLVLNYNGGYVGIGNNSVIRSALTVKGDAMIYSAGASALYVGESTTDKTYLVAGTSAVDNGYCYLQSVTSYPDNGNLIINSSGGNVGIGNNASPSEKLYVTGNIGLASTYKIGWDDLHVSIYGNSASDYLSFYTSNSEQMRLNSSGNLQIGNSTRNGKLSVLANTAGTISGAINVNAGENAATTGTSNRDADNGLLQLGDARDLTDDGVFDIVPDIGSTAYWSGLVWIQAKTASNAHNAYTVFMVGHNGYGDDYGVAISSITSQGEITTRYSTDADVDGNLNVILTKPTANTSMKLQIKNRLGSTCKFGYGCQLVKFT